MSNSYQFSLFSIVCLFLITIYPLQAKFFYNMPPPKVLKKQRIKQQYRKFIHKKKYPTQKQKPAKVQENAPSVGTVIGWLLLLWLLWWIVMTIPIILGLVFNLTWLWILGIILGCLPLLFVLGLFLMVLLGGNRTSKAETNTTI